eukprot:TRINITY_DN1067_c0_g1_i1.p1 TRINITY_DN1067_c0_g1~~TRINITY_DN1067_c0_g1_i1.p1  ORF type:complete len:542 (-),score=136.99 TRINITY_DN1067_c0_g1_i1:151-1635(-)
MAPEILKLQKYTVKADLWSVGCILFEMLVGHPPYPVKTHFELLQMIDKKKDRISFPTHIKVSLECQNLVDSLMQQDPMKRISWEEFFLHPWLNLHPTIASAGESQATSSSQLSFSQQIQNLSMRSDLPSSQPMQIGGQNPRFVASAPAQVSSPPERSPFSTSLPIHGSSPPSKLAFGSPPVYFPPQKVAAKRASIDVPLTQRPKSYTFNGTETLTSPRHHTLGSNISHNNFNVRMSTSPSPPDSLVNSGRTRAPSDAIRMPKTKPFKEETLSPSSSSKLTSSSGLNSSRNLDSDRDFEHKRQSSLDRLPSYDSLSNLDEKRVSELDAKGRRALVIAALGDIRAQSYGTGIAEAFSLYIKALTLLWTVLQSAKRISLSQSLGDSGSNLLHRYREHYGLYLKRAEMLKQHLKSSETAVVPEKIIYDFALQFGREGAVHELLKRFDKSEQYYDNGLALLEQLLSEATSEHDREVLQTLKSSFSHRLSQSRLSRKSLQ